MAGRPTDLTPETQEKIVSAIRAGNYACVAAAYAGISERTLYTWINRGKAEEEPYLQFLQALMRAEAEAEVRAVTLINRAMSDDWRAAIEYIRRKYPSRWSPPQRVSLGDFTPEQLAALAGGGTPGTDPASEIGGEEPRALASEGDAPV